MQSVPGRVHLVSSKRIPGCVPLGDNSAIEFLDGDPVRCEHRALIGSSIGRDGRPLLVQPHSHAAWICVLQNALQRKQAAAADNGGLNLVVSAPTDQTAVGVENLRQ
jgi:hypothetical protein